MMSKTRVIWVCSDCGSTDWTDAAFGYWCEQCQAICDVVAINKATGQPIKGKTDWTKFDALTEEDIQKAIKEEEHE